MERGPESQGDRAKAEPQNFTVFPLVLLGIVDIHFKHVYC